MGGVGWSAKRLLLLVESTSGELCRLATRERVKVRAGDVDRRVCHSHSKLVYRVVLWREHLPDRAPDARTDLTGKSAAVHRKKSSLFSRFAENLLVLIPIAHQPIASADTEK
ncbi:Hypothetical predicted protein [Cloeon dipterum]|uniref:Uncharacterized protein n=1 Tax=Cloeon dipterum TaxID=197152 RepID=A0A8S1BYT6_9INSE|nr:Hypothetical predicted protein [Cloeon dipterum]